MSHGQICMYIPTYIHRLRYMSMIGSLPKYYYESGDVSVDGFFPDLFPRAMHHNDIFSQILSNSTS